MIDKILWLQTKAQIIMWWDDVLGWLGFEFGHGRLRSRLLDKTQAILDESQRLIDERYPTS